MYGTISLHMWSYCTHIMPYRQTCALCTHHALQTNFLPGYKSHQFYCSKFWPINSSLLPISKSFLYQYTWSQRKYQAMPNICTKEIRETTVCQWKLKWWPNYCELWRLWRAESDNSQLTLILAQHTCHLHQTLNCS